MVESSKRKKHHDKDKYYNCKSSSDSAAFHDVEPCSHPAMALVNVVIIVIIVNVVIVVIIVY